MDNDKKHLFYLDELSDYKIESGDFDVRGWAVKDKEGKIIGKVDNLLVHKEREKVIYLDVEVDNQILQENVETNISENEEELGSQKEEDHLIIPTGFVAIDEENHTVQTDKIGYGTFVKIKRIPKGTPIDRSYEEVVLKTYNLSDEYDNTETIGSRKAFEEDSDSAYMDNFYDRKEFDRSPPFRFGL